jgi:hypothetical protein
MCFACRVVAQRLGLPLAPVFPVRLCPAPSGLYTVLMGYKESAVDDARRRFVPIVRRLLREFLTAHGRCLARALGGQPHVVVPVPSTARPSGAPLAAIDCLGADVQRALPSTRFVPQALTRAEAHIGHMHPAAGAFAVPAGERVDLVHRRVVLLDDTYVSGARAQSAAAALHLAGVGVVVVVTLGRLLRPDRSAVHAAFLRRHVRDAADLRGVRAVRCCRCVQAGAETE